MYEVVVVGDENDADYITRIEDANHTQIELLIKPIANAIKKVNEKYKDNYIHNWPMTEYNRGPDFDELYVANDLLTQDQIDEFDEEFIPYCEHGIHTIKSIEYYEKPEKVKLL